MVLAGVTQPASPRRFPAGSRGGSSWRRVLFERGEQAGVEVGELAFDAVGDPTSGSSFGGEPEPDRDDGGGDDEQDEQ